MNIGGAGAGGLVHHDGRCVYVVHLGVIELPKISPCLRNLDVGRSGGLEVLQLLPREHLGLLLFFSLQVPSLLFGGLRDGGADQAGSTAARRRSTAVLGDPLAPLREGGG